MANQDDPWQHVEQPYETELDVDKALDHALHAANAHHDDSEQNQKKVLLSLGAEWCPDCTALAGMLRTPSVAKVLEQSFEVVPVHIGRYDKNMHILGRLGLPPTLEGVPALVIASAPQGEVLNREAIYEWRSARTMAPRDLAAYLVRFARSSR